MWETVVGLEVHVELKTESKMFCSCPVTFGTAPQSNCCPVCLGLPGSLPVLNEKALLYAVKTGLALECGIAPRSRFDRKNYYYPDLPKAYQISQLYLPLCREGKLRIDTETGKKDIRIHEIHMEEDAGKLLHENGVTKIDYNRCGVPLIEIVTEPDFRNGDEAVNFLEKLRLVLIYLGVSDGKLQEGSMRADINLSVRHKGETKLGTRTEMKNLGSFRAVKKAIDFESRRQIEILENGGKVTMDTLRWDEDGEKAVFMRTKESAADYRYFPEPDLPEIVLSEERVEEIKKELPELREAKAERFVKEYGLPEYDALMLTERVKTAELFEKTVSLGSAAKEVSNWILGEGLRLLKERGERAENLVTPEQLNDIISLLNAGDISRAAAKEVFEAVSKEAVSVGFIVEQKGLRQINDDTVVKAAVLQVIAKNGKAVGEYRAGKDKVFGYLVGECMRALNGKGNHKQVSEILKRILEEYAD